MLVSSAFTSNGVLETVIQAPAAGFGEGSQGYSKLTFGASPLRRIS